MKNVKTFACMGFLMASMGYAKERLIFVETLSYPSEAAVHLDFIQQDLAQKAIESCGTQSQVKSISKITIQITPGFHAQTPVARLSNNGADLRLIYPKIKAKAKLSCLGD